MWPGKKNCGEQLQNATAMSNAATITATNQGDNPVTPTETDSGPTPIEQDGCAFGDSGRFGGAPY